jgi:hypothetical protein
MGYSTMARDDCGATAAALETAGAWRRIDCPVQSVNVFPLNVRNKYIIKISEEFAYAPRFGNAAIGERPPPVPSDSPGAAK